jgi:hypothetical protein
MEEMKKTALGIGLFAAALAALALPAAATAEYFVPPSNSAANQYTETYPTGGGQKQAGKGHGAEKHPAKVLGSRNAQRLDEQGADGSAAAEVAAATAPQTAVAVSGAATGGNGGDDRSASGSNPGGGAPADAQEAAAGSGGGEHSVQGAGGGSSGLGSIFSQATGSSDSGALGLLLPLAIFGAIAWSVLYLLRQRKRPTP